MDPLRAIYEQTADLFASAGGALSPAAKQRAAELFERFIHGTEAIDKVTLHGLFPLALMLLVLHENYRAMRDGTPFQVGGIALKTALVVVLYLSYGKVVGTITSVAGGGGDWFQGTNPLTTAVGGADALESAWSKMTQSAGWDPSDYFGPLARFLLLLVVWTIVLLAALCAYVATWGLAFYQGAYMAVLLAVGKSCIVLSLIPGVGLGKSWAKSLATVAAWSTVAGVIWTLIGSQGFDVKAAIAENQLGHLLMLGGQFFVLAMCVAQVPKITSALISGGGLAAGGVAVAAAAASFGLAGWGARTVGNTVGNAAARLAGRNRGPGEPGGESPASSGGRRLGGPWDGNVTHGEGGSSTAYRAHKRSGQVVDSGSRVQGSTNEHEDGAQTRTHMRAVGVARGIQENAERREAVVSGSPEPRARRSAGALEAPHRAHRAVPHREHPDKERPNDRPRAAADVSRQSVDFSGGLAVPGMTSSRPAGQRPGLGGGAGAAHDDAPPQDSGAAAVGTARTSVARGMGNVATDCPSLPATPPSAPQPRAQSAAWVSETAGTSTVAKAEPHGHLEERRPGTFQHAARNEPGDGPKKKPIEARNTERDEPITKAQSYGDNPPRREK